MTGTLYNKLGQYTDINLGNGVKTTFGYYGVGGTYDTSGGYYGRLWEIKSAVGANVRQDVKYTWDAGGNVASRQDVKFGGTETFTYDFLDRLTAVSGAYTQSFTYNQIGNILTMNGSSYTYGSKPHAVTQVGSNAFTYDNNGSMLTRGSQFTQTWDVENRLASVTVSGATCTFVYDGDGNRVKKTEFGVTTVYINKYYEKSIGTGTVTTYYYLGDKLVALRSGTDLKYVHQDHLGSTSVVTDSSGAQGGYMRYYPYGSTRDEGGSLYTSKLFTGQRRDSGIGLYYYGARYYSSGIGRFISADTIVPNPANPQSLNRYSYCLNNPLRYIDPSGHQIAPYAVGIGSGTPDQPWVEISPGVYAPPPSNNPGTPAPTPAPTPVSTPSPTPAAPVQTTVNQQTGITTTTITSIPPIDCTTCNTELGCVTPTDPQMCQTFCQSSGTNWGEVVGGSVLLILFDLCVAAPVTVILILSPEPVSKTAIVPFEAFTTVVNLGLFDIIYHGVTGEHLWD